MGVERARDMYRDYLRNFQKLHTIANTFPRAKYHSPHITCRDQFELHENLMKPATDTGPIPQIKGLTAGVSKTASQMAGSRN